jgi:hypothetical protein
MIKIWNAPGNIKNILNIKNSNIISKETAR